MMARLPITLMILFLEFAKILFIRENKLFLVFYYLYHRFSKIINLFYMEFSLAQLYNKAEKTDVYEKFFVCI